MGRKKIAVLGSGVGSMSAVHELLKSGQDFDITVYQMGWRLGGKGASGRNMTPGFGHRIEEHGLHMWSGLYENAFRIMRETYDALARPYGAPLATCFEAFKRHGEIVLWEKWQDKWLPWIIAVPPTSSEPGGARPTLFPPVWSFSQMFVQMLMGNRAKAFPPLTWLLQLFVWAVMVVGKIVGGALVKGLLWLLVKLKLTRQFQVLILAFADLLISALWRYAKPRLSDDRTRRIWLVANFAYGNLHGMIANDCLSRGLDFLDTYDYREWLSKYIHPDEIPVNGGYQSLTLGSPLMQFLYDAQFSYLDGDLSRPDIAAGSSIKTLLRMALTCKGAVLWRMQAAMGDVVFAPMYEVMLRKGVKFKFFHMVTALELDASKTSVARIKLRKQANCREATYAPLIQVNGLPCWPSEPLWDQLENGAELKARGVQFESYSDLTGEEVALDFGADFDEVIFGIPLAGIPHVASELVAANPRWQDLLKHLKTVQTQAVQVWLKAPSGDLNAPGTDEPLMVTYHATPLNTVADMSFLTGRESWQGGKDRYPVAQYYLCGPLQTREGEDQDQATAQVVREGIKFFGHLAAPLFPGATVPPNMPGAPFDDNLFIAPEIGTEPKSGVSQGAPPAADTKAPWSNLRRQYFRANISPSERFTLTNKGSTAYRIAPGDSGFLNLKLAGDWTQNTFNFANVEATTMSGMLCSQAICGYPRSRDIVGLGFGSKGLI